VTLPLDPTGDASRTPQDETVADPVPDAAASLTDRNIGRVPQI
jgi:hypothetical protein